MLRLLLITLRKVTSYYLKKSESGNRFAFLLLACYDANGCFLLFTFYLLS
jgi:deferrochelatase/peroxidase EfeB